jgi:hypothetical protein
MWADDEQERSVDGQDESVRDVSAGLPGGTEGTEHEHGWVCRHQGTSAGICFLRLPRIRAVSEVRAPPYASY